MRGSRVIFALPLLYQQLFYVPQPPVEPEVEAQFNFAQVTNSQISRRTLFYQANIIPPAFIPPPAPEDNINAATGITTGGVRSKTLFYQANIYALAPPVVAVVAPITIDKWQQPFTRATQRPPTETGLYTPFTPSPLAQPEADWIQPFRRAVQPPPPIHTQPVSGYQPVVSNLTTSIDWLQPFRRNVAGPFPVHTQPVSGYQPEAVVVSNLTTTLEWMQPWQKAVPAPAVRHTQVTNVPNQPQPPNTTTLEWQIAWQKAVPAPPARPTQPFYGYPYNGPNLTTTLEWLQPFKRQVAGPFPTHTQPVVGYVAPPEVTADEWLQPFQRAVPAPQVHHTQPVSGYQPEAVVVSNLTTTLEWQIAWQKAVPASKPVQTQPVLGTPPEPPVTPDKWLIAWQGAKPSRPVHTQPVLGSPYFLPNLTSTLEWQIAWQASKPTKPIHTQPQFGYPYFAGPNLTTTLEWQIAWQKAVPTPPARHTQPFYGYPYVSVPPPPNLTTTLEWLQRWQGPPRYWPIKVQQTPFIPKEFVQDQITPDKWLVGFQGAKPRKPIHTQPFLGRSDVAPPTQWLRGFDRAVAARPVRHTQPVSGYQPVVAPNLTTSIEWLRPFTVAVKPPTARPTQPFYGYPYEAAVVEVEEFAKAQVTSGAVFRRTLFYQSWAFGYPYVQAPPADNTVTIDKWQQPLGVVPFRLPATATQPFADFAPPPPVIVPPVEPPPEIVQPKHAHSQISSERSQTNVDVGAVASRVRVHTAHAFTSNRWRKGRTTIRTSGKSRTTPKDDP